MIALVVCLSECLLVMVRINTFKKEFLTHVGELNALLNK
jgi:hypothetical protein